MFKNPKIWEKPKQIKKYQKIQKVAKKKKNPKKINQSHRSPKNCQNGQKIQKSEKIIFFLPKICYPLRDPILGGCDSTRALQSTAFQNPGGGVV